MPKRPRKSKVEKDEDRKVYNNVVFQGARVMSGPNDIGFLEISTVNMTFTVIISPDHAEDLMDELRAFVRGAAPHFERNRN